VQICDKHQREEIAYESRYCPACDEITDLKETINDLQAKIDKLEEEE